MATAEGRRAAHDLVDRHLAEWAGDQDVDHAVERLVTAGVPASPVVDGPDLVDNPQLRARCAFEVIDSPLLGRHETIALPFRFASVAVPWTRRPAPTLGEHNDEILGGVLGRSAAELRALAAAGVIGTEPLHR